MAITPEQLFTTLPSVLKTAPIQYRNSLYTDPALYRAYYGELPSYMQWAEGKDGWDMDEFGAYNPDLLNSDNLDVVGYDANGNFQVKLKTADKEGTVYTYAKQPDGTYALQDAGQSQYWDTNQGLLEDPMALAMMLGVGAIAGGGIGAASGLWSDPLAAGAVGAGETATGGGTGLMSGASNGGVIDSILGQSTIPGSVYAAPGMAETIFPATTSLASPGTFAGVLPATAPAWGSGLIAADGVTALPGQPGYNPFSTAPTQTPTPSTTPTTQTPAPPAPNKDISSLLGSLPDSLKWLAPLVLGGLTAYETKNANGEVNAYGPSMDKYNSLLGRQWTQPQFTTGLMPPPTPKKYY